MQDATSHLDARGMNCPLPILRTRKAIAALGSGEVLEVTTRSLVLGLKDGSHLHLPHADLLVAVLPEADGETIGLLSLTVLADELEDEGKARGHAFEEIADVDSLGDPAEPMNRFFASGSALMCAGRSFIATSLSSFVSRAR